MGEWPENRANKDALTKNGPLPGECRSNAEKNIGSRVHDSVHDLRAADQLNKLCVGFEFTQFLRELFHGVYVVHG